MRKKKPLFILLVVMNIMLVVAVGAVFGTFMTISNDAVLDESMKGFKNDSANISNHFEAYLKSDETMAVKIAAYISESGMSYEETGTFLSYQQVTDGVIALLDVSTQKGLVYTSDQEKSTAVEIDYSDCTQIVTICDDLYSNETEDDESLHMTDVFLDSYSNENAVAFYKPVEINGEMYMVLYICKTADLISGGLSDQLSEYRQGILINQEGQLISEQGSLSQLEDFENYYSFIEETSGTDVCEQVKTMIQEESSGNFSLEGINGDEWVYAFEALEGTNGWVYVYCQSTETFSVDTGYRTALFIVVALMSAILILNVGVILYYNRKLKKNLIHVEGKNENLQTAVVEAEAANAAKSAFLSNMSHEIRTPINAILGLDELIIRESEEKQTREYARDIRSAGKTLLGLINDILDFSKIESGKMEIIPVEYELGSTVNDLYHMIEVKANEKGLNLNIQVDREMPHLLFGDEIRVKQIIINLLTNAVKYTEKGTVSLHIYSEKVDEEQIKMCVEITDTGIGLRPEEIDKLFQPFERIDEKRNRTIEGTGLGMSIVQQLLSLMGSQLDVKSEYEKGSTFSFKVIQKVFSWEQMGDFEERYRQIETEEKEYQESFQAPEARILVVDDTPMNLTVVKGLLKATQMQVDTAESGMECLELVSKNQYHMIFMDYRMPEMDGIETLKELRSGHLCDEVPVIVLTANAISGAEEEYRSEGFADFLGKPVDGKKLEQMILQYLPVGYAKKVVQDSDQKGQDQTKKDSNQEERENRISWYDSMNLEWIDPKAGLTACGSAEIYEQVLSEYFETIHLRLAELQLFYEEQDLKNYTIKVHGLKSIARMIGAVNLSKRAEQLEQAGNQNNWNLIERNTKALLEDFDKVKEMLRPGFDEEEKDSKKTMIEPDELLEALEAIVELSEAFDFDSIDSIIAMLDEYRMPDQMENLFRQLKQSVLDVDEKSIQKVILEMKDMR